MNEVDGMLDEVKNSVSTHMFSRNEKDKVV
jgi:hypothetical protein